jgi:biopolymer transport protein ExbD/biopolymer transport protein TolR
MLVLLIIFMVITPMLQNKVQVDMAKVDNPTAMPDADKEDAIVVAITRDGGVFLGQDKVAVSELLPRSRQAGRQAGKDHLCPCRCSCPIPRG